MSPEEPHVQITFRDMFDMLSKQGEVLSQMASDLKRALDSLDRTKETVADHEDRIRALEKKVLQASGIASFVGAAGGVVVSLIIR